LSTPARRDIPSVLERILASTRTELMQRKAQTPLVELQEKIERSGRDAFARERRFRGALAGEQIAVIAEFKRRSPSAGPLREDPDLRAIVSAYERGGARAVSVLTEGPHFEGALDDLRAARAACDLPLLRKDFVVDPYQLYEALATGADAVLLIVAALDRETLAELYARARALELDALVEVHDAAELHRALEIEADLIGVNNRDLRDFTVDVGRTLDLLGEIPAGVTVVSESGIAESWQLQELQERGVHAVLVGERLMRAPDPQAALVELRGIAEQSPSRHVEKSPARPAAADGAGPLDASARF
jgi:indole-3-glycerol phosphate synthase